MAAATEQRESIPTERRFCEAFLRLRVASPTEVLHAQKVLRPALCLLMIAVTLLFPWNAAAQMTDPVESGSEALQRAGDLPWYDAAKDDVRSVEVQPPPQPPARPDVPDGDWNFPKGNWSLRFGLLGFILQWLGWALIVGLIIGILVLIIRAIIGKTREYDVQSTDNASRITSNIDRLEQLPVPLKRSQSDLLGEAQRQYSRGNYNEAIVYFYSYLLVELDKAQHLRLVRGKTNRQYLRELREDPSIRPMIEETMIAFEDVFFGDYNLTRDRFDQCYAHLDRFHQAIKMVLA